MSCWSLVQEPAVSRVIFSNAAIGSFQGIRAKRTIDKLSLISAPKATVLRGGALQSIAVHEIVLDDVMQLSNGQQICADAFVRQGEVEVNESLITGESDPVLKHAGDKLLSGSFIVSGSCLAQVEHVGRDNYANRIANDAKYIKQSHSEIMHALNFIVKTIGFALIRSACCSSASSSSSCTTRSRTRSSARSPP